MRTEADRSTGVLEDAAAFYEWMLWEGAESRASRLFLERRGLSRETLRSFQVGFASVGWFDLQEGLADRDYPPGELRAAGLVQRSHRSERLYDYFRSRIMFPVRDTDGTIIGFAGLALHPGPSWPRWLCTPQNGRYDRGSVIYALDRALGAIEAEQQVLVLNDCAEVLKHHQAGRRDVVAVIHSDVTAEHVRRLATHTGSASSISAPWSPGFDPERPYGSRGSRERLVGSKPTGAAAPLPVSVPRRVAALATVCMMVLLSFAMWLAVPVGWLWIGSQISGSRQPDAPVIVTVAAGILLSMVGIAYVLLFLNHLYARLIRLEDGGPRVHIAWLKSLRTSAEGHRHGVLELILISSAGVALIAMAIWFFFFAKSPI
jgi:DNA primase-like protein